MPSPVNTARKMIVHHLQSVGYRIFSRRSQQDFLSLLPYRSDQEAADKLAWSLLPARASVLHARSLLASNQDSPIYKNVFVRSSEKGGGGGACTLVAGTQDVPLGCFRYFTYHRLFNPSCTRHFELDTR